ncbi:MAG: outer membrane beta-barrel protein [Saprospiraceae bacterium]|nr:outer membrane beta-barrel protein [Saprospiraceae bacterium]
MTKWWGFWVVMMTPLLMFAQNGLKTIKASVLDESGDPVVGAIVFVLKAGDSAVIQSFQTDLNGKINIQLERKGRILIKISHLGHKDHWIRPTLREDFLDLGDIQLITDSKVLSEVEIKDMAVVAKTKTDTTEFNASSFKTNPDANAEDLITKMPGVTVTDGKVQAQGEDVRQVTLDGKRFFGEDANAALRNLPSEVIDKIQIFDQRSDQSIFTGFDDGNTFKAINIVTRPQFRNGLFGRVWAGAGTEDRYKTGASINYFKGSRRLTFLGNLNNINEQNFSTEDLSGVLSGSGSSGGPRPGMGGGPGGGRPQGQRFGPSNNSDNFLVDQRSGIITTRAFGVNYSDQIGTLELTGSYFVNSSDNDILANLRRVYTTPANEGLVYTEGKAENQYNLNHRFNLRAEWKIDSFNSFQFTPRLSYQNAEIGQQNLAINQILLQQINQNQFNTARTSDRYNISAPLLYRHSFQKQGRTLSAQVNPSWNNGTVDYELVSFLEDYESAFFDTIRQNQDGIRNSANVQSNLSYTEPINDKSQFQISYHHQYAPSYSDQKTFQLSDEQPSPTPDIQLSNEFKSVYQSHRSSLEYRYNYKIFNLNAGLSYQYASLVNDQIFPTQIGLEKHFVNFLPNATMMFRFSQNKNLRINYRTSTNQPSAEQLQDVPQITNNLSVNSGNSNLNQEFRQNIFGRYHTSNALKGTSFFIMGGASFTQDYIGNNILIPTTDTVLLDSIALPAGAQWSRPVNLDGFWSLRSFLSYGLPIRSLKTNLNLNLGGFYTNTPSLLNDQLNQNGSLNLNGGIVLSSNISPRLDFTLSGTLGISRIRNSNTPELITLNTLQTNYGRIQWQFWKGLFIQTDVLAQFNFGLTGEANRNIVLWNAAVGYKFLKNNALDIRLQVFDLLQQNASVSRVVREAWYDDNFTNVVQQYFMLTATWQIRQFVSRS